MAHDVQLTELSSGLKVISARMMAAQSVSVGFWVNAGARDETASEHGIAHMLEHMAFKGTTSRDAAEIARQVEDKGGYINAHTSREETAYYLRLMPEDLNFGVELLADILIRSTFPEDEITREKGVIIQEIGQAHDTPDDIVFDMFQSISHPDHSLGRPILGTNDSVNGFGRSDLNRFMDRHYAADNIIISAAGDVDHDALVKLVETQFADLKAHHHKLERSHPQWPVASQARRQIMTRDLEQAHLVLGFQGVSITDQDRMALSAMSVLFGGGMSSRLFQEAREKRGLCYSVFSFNQPLSDSGVLAVYAGTSMDDAAEMIQLAGQELVDVAGHAHPEETKRAVAQMRAGLRMQQENVSSICESNARQMLLFGRVKPPAELLAELDAITEDDIRRVASRVLNSAPVLAGIGPSGEDGWMDEAALTAVFAA